MSGIELSADKNINITIISNAFIERFLPDAKEAYIKMYIYLTYCLQSGKSFSVNNACDFLGDTEKDILRAIGYWEKLGLIEVKRADKADILSIKLLNPEASDDKTSLVTSFVVQTPAISTGLKPVSDEVFGSDDSFGDEEDLKFIIEVAQKYVERFLSPAEIQFICDLYEKMRFPRDLVLHLYEYCAGLGKTDAKYIEKVGLSWADKGIRTVEQAEEASAKYNENYISVMKAFGLNRLPGTAERQYINKWVHEYGMPLEVITEACGRALIQAARPDFKYTDGILGSWRKKDCKTLEKIAEEDKLHFASLQAAKNVSGSPALKQASTRFNSFEQRSYSENDIKELEKGLLKTK